MNHENIKKYMFILGIITIVCFVGYWLYQCMGCGNGSDGGLQVNSNKQLGKIEGQQQQISNEITRAGAASKSAQDSIQRAQQAADRSKAAAVQISGELDNLQRTVKECRALAEANAGLIESLGKADNY